LEYEVLADNRVGLVAVAAWDADPRVVGLPATHPDVASRTIAIERESGSAAIGSVDAFGPSLPIAYGKCHVQTNEDKDAIWPKGFDGSR
jgi:hypothetical protein